MVVVQTFYGIFCAYMDPVETIPMFYIGSLLWSLVYLGCFWKLYPAGYGLSPPARYVLAWEPGLTTAHLSLDQQGGLSP